MNRLTAILLLLFFLFENSYCQDVVQGLVKDDNSGEPLQNASISFFFAGKKFGIITNRDGRFLINKKDPDSIRISMIGYQSKLLQPPFNSTLQTIRLSRAIASMETVIVRPLSAVEIIHKAIEALHHNMPSYEFENLAFYRETIKNSYAYFSISEALFKTQYFPTQKDFKLELEQGRTKEDVSYTRLFEDYHPGGGPQLMAKQELAMEVPACLRESTIKDFFYQRDSLTFLDNHSIYIISFDQKEGIKEALEKGKIFIDAEDFSIVSFTGENSPMGTGYLKSLTGADKIMAKILGINFQVLGWSRQLNFIKSNGSVFLNFAKYEQRLLYKQPKKEIDLNLALSFEWMASETGLPITKKISEQEEWKRNSLMVNLPTAFDSSFWGGKAIISPTDSLTSILRDISILNRDEQPVRPVEGWQMLNRKFFVASQKDNKISLTPTMKSAWKNETTGPFLFKDTSGDFSVECNLQVVKASNASEEPDKGFQQGGIMLRAYSKSAENYVMIALGTGGNPNPKVFFKNTENSRSKTIVAKSKNLTARIRMEKKGEEVKTYIKRNENDSWELVGEYEAPWIKGRVQIGMAVFADFAGNGPKMHPDVSFLFSDIEFEN